MTWRWVAVLLALTVWVVIANWPVEEEVPGHITHIKPSEPRVTLSTLLSGEDQSISCGTHCVIY